MSTRDDRPRHDDHDGMLRAVTAVLDSLGDERGELGALLTALVENQRSMTELLIEIARAVDALESVHALPLQDRRDAEEALRRESAQATRHTEQLLARSKTLLERGEKARREAASLLPGAARK